MDRLTFAPGSLEALAAQLGEVKTISEILFGAGINALDGIERVHVSPDDANGPQTDYLTDLPLTNDLAVLVPYEVTFRGFSPEVARVLKGFAASPHGFIVGAISVQPAGAVRHQRHRCGRISAGRGHAAGAHGLRGPGARAHAGQGRIADGFERTIVARDADGGTGQFDAQKLNAWNSSKEITRRSFWAWCCSAWLARSRSCRW